MEMPSPYLFANYEFISATGKIFNVDMYLLVYQATSVLLECNKSSADRRQNGDFTALEKALRCHVGDA